MILRLTIAVLMAEMAAAFTMKLGLRFNTIPPTSVIVMSSSSASGDAGIVSPFDVDGSSTDDGFPPSSNDDYELPLTLDNVEKVLDEMRPYLQSDGGDVKIAEIDGPVVRLELVGACGTCPSSSMTMKMGLERKLKERIPEIAEVVQALPDAPTLSDEEIEKVLDGVRPFLSVAGGKISVESITGVGGLQPVVTLKMIGSAAALQSVKLEIMQRIQRHFMLSLRIEWSD
jgi:Fe-S cluster biogenesis protein NfuA